MAVHAQVGQPALKVRTSLTLICLVAAQCLCVSVGAPARAGWNGMQRIAADLGGVTVMAQAPGDPNRIYIANKTGLVRTYNLSTGMLEPEILLNLLDYSLDTEGDGGLLGMAFHPDFQNNGKFYVTVTTDNGGIVVDPGTPPQGPTLSPYTAHVREYHVLPENPKLADHENWNEVVQWVKPGLEHTSGWLGFNPDNGYLHITVGDGGEPYDMQPGHTPGIGNAQDIENNLFGKMLRLDVDGDDFPADANRNYAIPSSNPFVGITGDDEIFAYGLRSPWRASFDRATGDIWIGDVGEGLKEEVDFIPAGSGGGQNFGWRLREGNTETPHVGGPPPPGNVEPVYDYFHFGEGGTPPFQGNSVTGGYVYRGPDPTLQGKYVFADFISARIWMFDPANPYGTVTNITPLLPPSAGSVQVITTFFEDSVGNLYLGTLSGSVFRLKTNSVKAGDFQPDGRVDGADFAIWRNCVGTTRIPGQPFADADGDADSDGDDFLRWQRNLGYDALNLPNTAATNSGVPEPASGVAAFLGLMGGILSRRALRRSRRR